MHDTNAADPPAMLPAFFAWNYIAAFEQTMDSYKTRKIMSRQMLTPGVRSDQWQRWVAPYLAQFDEGPQRLDSYRPLPYDLANIPYLMLRETEESMRWAMKSIGEDFWGGSPNSELPFHQGIGSSIAPAAELRLAQVFRAYREKHGRPPSYSQAIDAGLHLAAQAIQQYSGARMHITHQEGGRSITIKRCPFCAGAGEECGFFMGVTIGMLGWLNMLLDRQHLCHNQASVNISQSNGHRVWVDGGRWEEDMVHSARKRTHP